MDNLTKAEKQLLGELRREARQQDRECYHPDCASSTIKIESHLIQEKGTTLKSIAHEGHIYALLEDNLIKPENEPYYFEKRGVNKYQKFKGFCRDHDDEIFAEIEKRPFTISERVQWLFAYRGLVNEYNKQENNLIWYRKIRENDELKNLYYSKYAAIEYNMEWMFILSSVVKNIFDGYLFHDSRGDYCFECMKIPRIPVITSAVFIPPFRLKAQSREETIKYLVTHGLKQIVFINTIFTGSDSYLSIGYHPSNSNPESLRLISMFKDGKWREILNEVLIKHCETWACSEDFYKKSIKPREHCILNDIHRLLSRKILTVEVDLIRLKDIPS